MPRHRHLAALVVAFVLSGASARAETEYYVCPSIVVEEPGGSITTTPAHSLTGSFPDVWVTQWFEGSNDPEVVVGLTAPADAHAAVQADARCELVPGSPLSTELRGQKLAQARTFAARRMSQAAANRLREAHTKGSLVALLADQLARQRGHEPTWPREHCRREERVWVCDSLDSSSVP